MFQQSVRTLRHMHWQFCGLFNSTFVWQNWYFDTVMSNFVTHRNIGFSYLCWRSSPFFSWPTLSTENAPMIFIGYVTLKYISENSRMSVRSSMMEFKKPMTIKITLLLHEECLTALGTITLKPTYHIVSTFEID